MNESLFFEKMGFNVSRETFLKLETYVALLTKWQRAINLVSKNTLDKVWERHIFDSAQILKLIDKNNIADLGSGAGFPGMVIAILNPNFNITLIESDSRKCEFLREVKRKCNVVNVSIFNERIENLKEFSYDYVISRALASLKELLILSQNITNKDTKYVFLKGEKLQTELEEVKEFFNLKYDIYNSITDINGKIIKIQEVI
ncbi:MAG: Ribosomal RNA small subunit methyltransferase G [Alphaproteobacteria bacterium ADurb.Bin438]|nr:MAG: Ribosomal RNA small subunit methyltransferase G [Alphaproteobacteria bacterium ADurb.Bin438]